MISAHDQRIMDFKQYFKDTPEYGNNILISNEMESKLIDKIIKEYASDLEDDKECIIGLYDFNRKPKGKYGILFTDYKMYCNYKKEKRKKIWYDEIVKVKVKLWDKKKIIIRTDDGCKFVLEASKYISREIVEFIKIIREYNEEIAEPNVKLFFNQDNVEAYSTLSGIEIGKRNIINRGFEEEKFHSKQGHGFAAERANDMVDKFHGKKTQILGDNNIKNGPDRSVKLENGTLEFIQTKYCQTASDSINACFDNTGFRYYDRSGKPMSIEVPRDQYEAALELMKKKIELGKVDGVSDPADAKKIVKKGNITYKQAVNIAKAGTIESLTYDMVNGVVASASAFGVSAIISLASSIWNGDGFFVATKNAAYTGVKVSGTTFITSIMASQLSKAGLNSMLVSSSEKIVNAMGSEVSASIVNSFRGSASNIYGAAAMKSAAKLLRTNIITSIIMIFVFSIGDFINMIQRRITFKQFAKNFIVLALSIFAGVIGGIIGGWLGSLIIAGIGSAIGSILGAIIASAITGYFGKKLLGIFIKDDAEDMVKIIQKEFGTIVVEYLLSKNEAEKIIDKLVRKLSIKEIRKMVANRDKAAYARKLLIPLTEKQVQKRKRVIEPSPEVIIESLKQINEGDIV